MENISPVLENNIPLLHVQNQAKQLHSDTETFAKIIHSFCDRSCEVCTKLYYPNQNVLCRSGTAAASCLNVHLLQKSHLLFVIDAKKKILPIVRRLHLLDLTGIV